jgi:hypothetical protein
MPGHAAAPRERRVEHVRRQQGGARRGAPAGPARFRKKVLVRVDGAGASHDLIGSPAVAVLAAADGAVHLRVDDHRRRRGRDRESPRRRVKARHRPGRQRRGGQGRRGDHGPDDQAGNWPDGLHRITRRVKPPRRHLRNLTDYEKKTGWKHSITRTNIPDAVIAGVPGSHHSPVHRHRAPRSRHRGDCRVRTAKAVGLRNPL